MKYNHVKISKARLYTALLMNEIIPHYQPIINVHTMDIYGLEILIRWREHDSSGTFSPAEIVEAFEEQGLIMKLTQYLLQHVAKDMERLEALLPGNLHIAINVSATHLQSAGFAFDCLSFLSKLPLNKATLTIEVTENIPLKIDREFEIKARRLQLAGVKILLDDFGTGYSNLCYIELFDFDGIKIDKIFIDRLKAPAQSSTILPFIVEMTRKQQLTLIAEGVETTVQRDQLCQMGVMIQQGFLFSTPLDVDALIQYLILQNKQSQWG